MLKLRAAEGGQKERLMIGDTEYTQLFDTQLRILETLHAKLDRTSAQEASSSLQQQLENIFGRNSFEGAELKYLSGCLLLDLANYKAADTIFREVTKTVSACVGAKRAANHPLFLSATGKIGEIAQHQGRYEDSDFLYQKTIEAIGASHVDINHSLRIAQIREGYSKLQLPLGRPTQALELLTAALDARRKVPGLSRDALFSSYVVLALQEVALGHMSQARTSLHNLVEIQDRTELTKGQQADIKLVQSTLALELKQDLPYAAMCIRDALALRREVVASDHPAIVLHKLLLALILIETQHFDETMALCREITSALSYIYGKSSPHIAIVKRVEARVLIERGLYLEAETVVKDALVIDVYKQWVEELVGSGYQKAVPSNNKYPAVLEDLELLGSIFYLVGKLEYADRLMRQTQSVATDIYATMHHPIIARSLVALGKMRIHSGDYVEAHQMLTQGVELQANMLGADHPHVILSQLELVELLALVGDAQAAMQTCGLLRSTLIKGGAANMLQLVVVDSWVARLQFSMGQTLKPWGALMRSFVALDHALELVKATLSAQAAAAGAGSKGAKNKGKRKDGKEAAAPSKSEEEMEQEAADLAMAQKLSNKLATCYTHTIIWLAEVHLHNYGNHQATMLLRIAVERYQEIGVLGKQGQGSAFNIMGQVAMHRGRMIEARASFLRAQAQKNVVRYSAASASSANTASDSSSNKPKPTSAHPEVLPDLEAAVQMSMWSAHYRRAKDVLQQALDLSNNQLASRNSRRASTLLLLSAYMQQVGRYREAYKVLDTAVASLKAFSERSPLMYKASMQQACLDAEVGFLDEAERQLEAVEDLGVLPPKHPDVAVLALHKATLHVLRYEFKRARQLMDEAISLLATSGLGSDARRGKDRQSRLALACNHIAAKHTHRPMLVKLLNVIVPAAWQLLDKQDALHPLRMRFSLADAMLSVQEGKFTAAQHMLVDLKDRYRQHNSEAAATSSHPLMGCCDTGLAQLAYAQGNFREALDGFGLALKSKLDGGWLMSHVSIGADHHGMGVSSMSLGRYVQARTKLRVAKSILAEAATQAHTFASLAVDITMAQLALELGAVRRDAHVATENVHQVEKINILKRIWFMSAVLDEDSVASERVLRQVKILKIQLPIKHTM